MMHLFWLQCKSLLIFLILMAMEFVTNECALLTQAKHLGVVFVLLIWHEAAAPLGDQIVVQEVIPGH